MRITFVMGRATMAGGARIIASLAEGLAGKGHDVLVVSLPPRKPSWRQSIRSLVRDGAWPKAPALGPSYLDEASVEHRILDRWRAVVDSDVPDADAVVATWWETAPWVHDLSPAKGAKAYFIQQYEVNFGHPAELVDATWRLPLYKIVCSKWLAELAAERFDDSHAVVVNNGIDTDRFHAPPRGKQPRPTVGFMYSTAQVKGCDVSLQAIELAAKQVGPIHIRAFGTEKPDQERLPLPSDAEYWQLPPQEKLRDIYAGCDVWLCGSHSEGFHLPPHEAMACRCPVVSTNVGGPMDYVEHGVNGYLYPPGDAEGLAEGLVQVLGATDERWRAMSDAAYDIAIGYTWDRAVERFEQALRQAADAQKPAPIVPA